MSLKPEEKKKFPNTNGVDPDTIFNTPNVRDFPPDWPGNGTSNLISPLESCMFKSAIAVVAGAAFGVVGAVFLGAMDTSHTVDLKVRELSTKEQIKHQFRSMGTRSKSMSKNFAVFGGLVSGIECQIEKTRGVHDANNIILAGCLTGSLLAARQGPAAAAFGCGSSAALFYAFEKYQGNV